MPRKEWIQKNKYCKRSRLSSNEFIILVTFYFHEILFSESRDSYRLKYWIACRDYSLRAKLKEELGLDYYPVIKSKNPELPNDIEQICTDLQVTPVYFDDVFAGKISKLSKKSINSYFNKMSQYIWDRFVVGLHPMYQEKGVFDDLLGMIYERKNSISSRELTSEIFKHFPFFIIDNRVASSLMFYLLSRRSKVVRGFARSTFHLEFSRVFFVCVCVELTDVELRSIYSVDEEDIAYDLVYKLRNALLKFLEEKPM